MKIIDAVVILLIIGLVTVPVTVPAVVAYSTDEIVTITVKDKERVVTDTASKYLVFTDKGVYENTDTVWYWKWDSSDVYNDLEIGKTYQVKVYGFRVPFLSWYKNIVELDLIAYAVN